jgi:hypothetical protein
MTLIVLMTAVLVGGFPGSAIPCSHPAEVGQALVIAQVHFAVQHG